MKTSIKIITITLLLFLIIGTAYAIDLKDTTDVKVNGNHLEIDGKTVAEVKEFNTN